MKRIKILFIIDTLTVLGGTEKHLLQVLKNISHDKFDCSVWTFAINERMIMELNDINIHAKILPINRIYGIEALFHLFPLVNEIKYKKIDIVQSFHFSSDTYGVFVAKLAGVLCIISSRRDFGDLKTKSQIFLNRITNKFITGFTAVADTVGNRFRELEHIAQKKLFTIYNGIDLKEWKPVNIHQINKIRQKLGIDPDSFVVGKVAHLRPEKGYKIFFNSLGKVKKQISNLKVVVVGSDPCGEKERLKKYCQQCGIEKDVIFIDYTEDIKKYVSIMDLFCLTPIKNEGLSNAILEAMALEKPVIATDIGGNREIVINDVTGTIVPPNDPEALQQAILKYYHQPKLRKAMGLRGRAEVEENFSLEKMVNKLDNLYVYLYQNRGNGH